MSCLYFEWLLDRFAIKTSESQTTILRLEQTGNEQFTTALKTLRSILSSRIYSLLVFAPLGVTDVGFYYFPSTAGETQPQLSARRVDREIRRATL